MRTTNPQHSISIYGPLMGNGTSGGGDDPKDPNNGDDTEIENGDPDDE